MLYTCDNCHYIFPRTSEETCPDCGKATIRPATEAEEDDYKSRDSHDGKPQLTIAVHGIDIVGYELHCHSDSFQLSGIAEGINNITRKSTDFFGENKLEPAFMGIPYHTVKLPTFSCAGTRYPLISVNFIQIPIRIF